MGVKRPSGRAHTESGSAVTEHRRTTGSQQGFPPWLTNTVVLTILGLLVYNILVVGPPGYPISMMLGGLLGAYRGADELLKRRSGGDDPNGS